MANTILLRRDNSADWESKNPTLNQGEPGIELDTNRLKIGDGTTSWQNLEYETGVEIVNNSVSFFGIKEIEFSDNLSVVDDGTGRVVIKSVDQGINIEEKGTVIVNNSSGLSFGDFFDVTDDGDGSASVKFRESWEQISDDYTAGPSERLLTDTSSNPFTVFLLSSPSIGDTVWFADSGRSWGTNNLTVDGNGNNILGSSTYTASTTDQPFSLVYNGTQWILGS